MITNAQGLVIHNNDLFVSGNITNGNYWEGVMAKGHLEPIGTRTWTEVARTQPYARGGKDHGFNGITVSPDGTLLDVISGSCTDHGEPQEMNGTFLGFPRGSSDCLHSSDPDRSK